MCLPLQDGHTPRPLHENAMTNPWPQPVPRNNAVKYSGAHQLCFRVDRRPPMLVVAVEDDGRGFDLGRAQAVGNGLANLEERMRDIGGLCRITTAPGSGCRVELEVPLTRFARRAGPRDAGVELLANGRHTPPPAHEFSEEAHPS